MSNTKNMMRQHSAFYKAKRDAAAASGQTTTSTTTTKANPPPPSYYDVDNTFNTGGPDQLPAYTRRYSIPATDQSAKTLRKGHRIGDFFGAAFTGYIPKERAPAFEVFEPRHRESMGSTPGAVEVRRCTGGMSSSGKKKEKRDKEKKDGVA